MLELINDARTAEGLQPITLGDNAAAQLHAEAALEGCFGGHWGKDGLKPYMRYSLAGGYQSNAENGSGFDYCIKDSDWVAPLGDVRKHVKEGVDGWMGSPDHRTNVLSKWHRKVNIGLAWDRYRISAYQHFEGDYVQFDRLSSIRNGILQMVGHLKNGAALSGPDDLFVQLYYDPPPHVLTRGQLARTYCYGYGVEVASLVSPGGNWVTGPYEYEYAPCPDPYDVSDDAAAPSIDRPSVHLADLDQALNSQKQKVTSIWIKADEWVVTANSFSVRANVSDILVRYGPGVYSVVVRALLGGETGTVAEYSIFHETDPPHTYSSQR